MDFAGMMFPLQLLSDSLSLDRFSTCVKGHIAGEAALYHFVPLIAQYAYLLFLLYPASFVVSSDHPPPGYRRLLLWKALGGKSKRLTTEM